VTKRTGAGRRRRQLTRDPHLVGLEEQLQRILGTKVKIIPGRKRGKIILEYYSLTDLERILNLLKRVK
jgi:ParB family chromosome partitioning protein